MKKRTIRFMLSLILLLANVTPAQAIYQERKSFTSATLVEEVAKKTQSILQFIETEKALYGLSNVDFSALELGEQIPGYILDETGTLLKSDIFYFPILSGMEWVATSIVSFDSIGDIIVQITTEYAKIYNRDSGGKEDLCLVFDDSAAYILTESDVIKAATFPNITAGRGSLEQNMDVINAELGELAAVCTVGTDADICNPYVIHPFDSQDSLQVPSIQQAANSWQCWAACIASIRGYYGTTTTIDNVYDISGVTKYNGANVYTAANTLEAYGFKLNWGWDGSYNWFNLRNAICFNRTPIYAHISYTPTTAHAVVIRGYYVFQTAEGLGIITYMDPADGEYGASIVSNDCEFYYVPNGNSAQYTMATFLEVAN